MVLLILLKIHQSHQGIRLTICLLNEDCSIRDLTGYDGFKSEIRESACSTEVIATFDVIIPNPTDGCIVLKLTVAKTAAFECGCAHYVHDLLIRKSGSPEVDTECVLEGRVTVNENITEF